MEMVSALDRLNGPAWRASWVASEPRVIETYLGARKE
jgi:hypothetical protein